MMPARHPTGAWRRRYLLLLELARAAIFWEILWPRLWPAVAVAAVFVSVALLDLLPMLPFWLHSLVLVGFAVLFGYRIRGAVRNFPDVDDDAAEHRLERDSGLDHRPLRALHDRQVTGLESEAARGLWQAHLRRMADAAEQLRVRWPSPGLARLDPLALRAVVGLFLVVGVVAAGSHAWGRLERALAPRLDGGPQGAMEFSLWITPPAYTGAAPMFLERSKETLADAQAVKGEIPPVAALTVPVGSTLLAQTGDSRQAPELVIGAKIIQFADIGKSADGKEKGSSFRVETVIGDENIDADILEVRLGGRKLAAWPIAVAADAPPEVEFTRAPSRAQGRVGGRAQLRIDYEARDDYGLAGLQVVARRPDGIPVPGGEAAILADLPLPGLGSKKVEGNVLKDFSAHPWAGMAVLMTLETLDARGQAGFSDSISVVLPQRVFNHPVARALAEARKQLNNPEPAVIAEVLAVLNGIASRPQHFFDDTTVFLALSVAQSRLIHDETPEGAGAVQVLLWETALRIEDGEFAIAERDLRKAQERLMQSLKNGADAREMERLMDEMKEALDKYLAALAEHLQKQGLTQLPVDPNARAVDSSDLQRMIEEARDLARTGSLEAARKMLSDLKRMLDSIRNGLERGKPRKDVAQAKRILDKLRDLTRRQGKELDRTFRRQRDATGAMQGRPRKQGQRKGQKGPGKGEGVSEQQALRRELGRLMRQMGDILGNIPPDLDKAERAMKGAVRGLQKGDLEQAQANQTVALEKLRQGQEGMAEQMARRLGRGVGISRGQAGGQPGQGIDPFGRRAGGALGGNVDDGATKVPGRMERRQAHEILRELRRRAGERTRPLDERDSIERLLKRF